MRHTGTLLAFFALLAGACSPKPTSAPTPTLTATLPPPRQIYLSDLQPREASVGFSELGVGVYPFSEDPIQIGETITVLKTPYPHGLFTHAPARIEYDLTGRYANLTGAVMMSDAINCGSVEFMIFVDDREAFHSGVHQPGTKPEAFSVDLAGARELRLEVDALGSMDCDWSVWGDPLLTESQLAAVPEISTAPGPTAVPAATATPLPAPTQLPTLVATVPPTLAPAPLPAAHPGWMPEGAVARFGKGSLLAIEAAPDSSFVALAAAGGIYLADPLTARTIGFIETRASVSDLAFSADGSRLFAGLGKEGIQTFVRAGESWTDGPQVPLPCAARLAVSFDGSTLLAKCFLKNDTSLTSWDLTSNRQNFKQTYVTPKQIGFAMAFSPTDPKVIAVANYDILRLLDAKTGAILAIYNEPARNMITDVKFSPDGKRIAISPYSPVVTILDAASLEEVKRVEHETDVYMLSFVSDDTLVSIDQDWIVVHTIDGRILKKIPHGGRPTHAFLPGKNILVADSYFNADFISLETFQTLAKMPGFHPSYWVSHEFSGDGNTFLGELAKSSTFWYSHASKPDAFEAKDIAIICPAMKNSRYLNLGINFVDNAGNFIDINCEDTNELLIVELKSMKVVTRLPYPLRFMNNTNSYFHPWPDSREMQALLYANPAGSAAAYRVEVWELLKQNKVAAFDVDAGEKSWIYFSPGSTYLGVSNPGKKVLTFYETASGRSLSTIPLDPDTHSVQFDQAETVVFLSRNGSVKAYAIQGGELLQTLSGLPTGEIEGMAYFDSGQRLISYAMHGKSISFDVFNLESGEKISSLTMKAPTDRHIGSMIYFPPSGDGKIAVLYNPGDIHFVDIETGAVLKTCHWESTDQTGQPLPIGNFLFADENPVYFYWDLALEE